MINEKRLVEIFLSLVKIDSPSFREGRIAEYLKKWADEKGFLFEMDNAGSTCGGDCGNVIIKVPATGEGSCPAFSAHMDCVSPCIGVDPVIDGDIIKSGSATVLGGDDKAGIAAILEAVSSLSEESIPHPELTLIFTIVEEAGMFGAKALDTDLIKTNEILVLDAEGDVGTLINRSPAKTYIDIEFKGKAAHAGMNPELGVSAIQLAAEAITRMKLLRIDEHSTANIGTIKGGVATNIVADAVFVSAEARSASDDKLSVQIIKMQEACEKARALVGGDFLFKSRKTYPSVNIPENDPLIARVSTCCKLCGIKPSIKSTGGGSDANVYSGKGISALTLGIGMSKVHTVDEFISIKSLIDAARLTVEIMRS